MPNPEHDRLAAFISELEEVLGTEGLLTDAAARLVYSRDASHLYLGRPVAVALPADADQLRRVIRRCRDEAVPVVCRGNGTGLSGGAVPGEGTLVLGTSRLTGLGQVDPVQRRVRVEPGVLNDRVTRHASRWGLHFAPDPSSQSAASIGGNIAENAGGPHCLKHGVTLQHLLRLEWTDANGRLLQTGRGLPVERGLDLVSLLCGSEGTLGIVTAADLKLLPEPPEVATLLAFFPVLEDAVRSVIGLLGEGLAPVAVEMVDQPMLAAVEEAFGFGFPTDVEAAMITEFAGPTAAVAEDSDRAAALLGSSGAREVRRAADAGERAELWKCRKKAFGAVGRLAPCYVSMDVVVPLGELPGLVREIQVIKTNHDVEIATSFHAGDGNLHPGVHYDDRDPELTNRAHAASDDIIKASLDRGGSITGEHGVGIEKLHAVPWQLDGETARLQRGIKDIFDPGVILNPGKLHPPSNAEFAPLKPSPVEIEFQWANLTVSAPADALLVEIQRTAMARGFWIPVGVVASGAGVGLGRGATLGDLVADMVTGPAFCAAGTARDYLLELWAETGDGRPFHAGAPVFKNVAGYDLIHMLCGSGRVWVQPRAATFQLRPVPESLGYWRFQLNREKSPGFAGLEKLTDYLASRDNGLGGPVLVVDDQADASETTVVVLVSGRSRPWDLGQVDSDLIEIMDGQAPAEHLELEFPRASELLVEDLMPAWALDSPQWTFLCRTTGAPTAMGWRPPGIGRIVWQSTPCLVWTPDQVGATVGWYADPYCSAGRILSPPVPMKGVPLDILHRMKSLFDPTGVLDMPEWLEGADD